MLWKIDNYVFILQKMYWGTFSNASGNVLKKLTNKNGKIYGNLSINLR